MNTTVCHQRSKGSRSDRRKQAFAIAAPASEARRPQGEGIESPSQKDLRAIVDAADGPPTASAPEAVGGIMDVNFLSALAVTQTMLPLLAARQPGGSPSYPARWGR